jgi:hypothetical protein
MVVNDAEDELSREELLVTSDVGCPSVLEVGYPELVAGYSSELVLGCSAEIIVGYSAELAVGCSAEVVGRYSSELVDGYSAELLVGYSSGLVDGYSAELVVGYPSEVVVGYSAELVVGYAVELELMLEYTIEDIVELVTALEVEVGLSAQEQFSKPFLMCLP